MSRVGSPAVSPDGRWVAFTVTNFSREENKSQRDLWLVPSDGSAKPRRLTWQKGSDGSPAWSPDGKTLAFVSKRGEDDPAQLYLLPMAGGEAERVTDLPIAPGSPKWFPDGKRIAFAAKTLPDLNDDFDKIKERLDAQKEDKTNVKISDRRLLRYWDHYRTDGTVHHVFVLDLESREVKDSDAGLRQPHGLPWLRVGPLTRRQAKWPSLPTPRGHPGRSSNFAVFLLVRRERTRCARITERQSRRGTAIAGTTRLDGRYLLFGRTHRPEIAPDFTRLARYDRKSGEIRRAHRATGTISRRAGRWPGTGQDGRS